MSTQASQHRPRGLVGAAAWLRRRMGRPMRLVIAGLVLLCSAALVLPALSATGHHIASAPAAPATVSGPSTAARTSTPTAIALTAQAVDPAPAPVATAPAPAAASPAATVHLGHGDTLWTLAHRYGTTVAALQALNHLGHATRIYADTDLHIPAEPARSAAPAPAVPTAHRPAVTSGHAAARPRHPVPVTIPATGAAQQAAADMFGPQYGCAAHIITRESGWNPRATNSTSGAYGLAQALPGSKMATAGPDWATNPTTQLAWMRDYVTARYGGACAAWNFWQTHHWY